MYKNTIGIDAPLSTAANVATFTTSTQTLGTGSIPAGKPHRQNADAHQGGAELGHGGAGGTSTHSSDGSSSQGAQPFTIRQYAYPLSSTPWGEPENQEMLAPGIIRVSTAAHGGIWLSPARLAQLPPILRSAPTYEGYEGFYEEDDDRLLTIVAFPQYFTARECLNAIRTLYGDGEGYEPYTLDAHCRAFLDTPEARPVWAKAGMQALVDEHAGMLAAPLSPCGEGAPLFHTGEPLGLKPKKQARGWTLLIGEERNRRHPHAFPIPASARRRRVLIGQLAKLCLRNPVGGCAYLWVEVAWRRAGAENCRYIGEAISLPRLYVSHGICEGNLIEFSAHHILDLEPE